MIFIIHSLLQLLLFLSDRAIQCIKNALNVKAKVQKMKLFINQSNSIIISAVSGKHILAWASSIREKHKKKRLACDH